jgi:hypothetical protein
MLTDVSSRAHSTVAARSIQGKSVTLIRNQYPRTDPKVYRVITFEKLLADAMELCQLNEQARKVFKADGSRVKSLADISDQDTLYISSGEPFGFGVGSPAKKAFAPKPAALAAPSADATPPAQITPSKSRIPPVDEPPAKLVTPSSTKTTIKLVDDASPGRPAAQGA